MKKIVILLVVIGGLVEAKLLAQAENNYSTETVFGINLNTNGGLIGGVMFRHAREWKRGLYYNFGAEVVNVKHPNEVRISNSATGSVFVLGKQNYLFSFRPRGGIEMVLFNKGREDGVQVDLLVGGGPTIGLLKPYYIQYDNGVTVENVAYNPTLHDPATKGAGIMGNAGFFYGLNELKVVPGLHFHTGVSFEFGSWSGGVSGIEAGTLIELFPYKIDILQVSSSFNTYNRSTFSSFYVNLYFGGRN